MYKKHCTRCYQSSFSSCKEGQWLCPTCNNDLTKNKAIVAHHRKDLTTGLTKYQTPKDLYLAKTSKISYRA